jgi:5'-nucleotidase
MAYFLDGMPKGRLLSELKPLIFFDDSLKNCDDACKSTPTARVPIEKKANLVITLSSGDTPHSRDRFFNVCKLYLKKDFAKHESKLRLWEEQNLSRISNSAFERLTDELERSAKGTPPGKQRRAAGENNDDCEKLLTFLDDLKRKHS